MGVVILLILAGEQEGEEAVSGEQGVAAADRQGHGEQQPLAPGPGGAGLQQEGVPRPGNIRYLPHLITRNIFFFSIPLSNLFKF